MTRSEVVSLRDRAEDALAQLRGLRSSDQAASSALRAARLTALTLECWWIPALDAGDSGSDDRGTG